MSMIFRSSVPDSRTMEYTHVIFICTHMAVRFLGSHSSCLKANTSHSVTFHRILCTSRFHWIPWMPRHQLLQSPQKPGPGDESAASRQHCVTAQPGPATGALKVSKSTMPQLDPPSPNWHMFHMLHRRWQVNIESLQSQSTYSRTSQGKLRF